MIKTALIIEDGEQISVESAEWARDLIVATTKALGAIIKEKITENPHHKQSNKALEVIRAAGQILKRDFTRKTRWLKNYEREEVLKDLIEAELIEAVMETGTKKLFYIAKPLQ